MSHLIVFSMFTRRGIADIEMVSLDVSYRPPDSIFQPHVADAENELRVDSSHFGEK